MKDGSGLLILDNGILPLNSIVLDKRIRLHLTTWQPGTEESSETAEKGMDFECFPYFFQ